MAAMRFSASWSPLDANAASATTLDESGRQLKPNEYEKPRSVLWGVTRMTSARPPAGTLYLTGVGSHRCLTFSHPRSDTLNTVIGTVEWFNTKMTCDGGFWSRSSVVLRIVSLVGAI